MSWPACNTEFRTRFVTFRHLEASLVDFVVLCSLCYFRTGRALAHAVSHWLYIAAARVRARVRLCGICGGQSGTGAGFLRVLQFPLPIFIPQIAPQSPATGASTIGQ
jgi:hypothetical protein